MQNFSGYLVNTTLEKGCWPFAPGPDDNINAWTTFLMGLGGGHATSVKGWANSTGVRSYWGQKYSLNADSHGQTRTSSANSYDWPSFIPAQWEPYEGVGGFSLGIGTYSPSTTIPGAILTNNFGISIQMPDITIPGFITNAKSIVSTIKRKPKFAIRSISNDI